MKSTILLLIVLALIGNSEQSCLVNSGIPVSLANEYTRVFSDCQMFEKIVPKTYYNGYDAFSMKISPDANLEVTYEWSMSWKVRSGFEMIGPMIAKFNIIEMKKSPFLTIGYWDFEQNCGTYMNLEDSIGFYCDWKRTNAVVATKNEVKHYTPTGVKIVMKKPTIDSYWSKIDNVHISPDWKLALISCWLDLNRSALYVVSLQDNYKILHIFEGSRYFFGKNYNFINNESFYIREVVYSTISFEIVSNEYRKTDDFEINFETIKSGTGYAICSVNGQEHVRVDVINSYWNPVMMRSNGFMLVGNSDGNLILLQPKKSVSE